MQAGHLYETINIQQKSVARGADFGEEQITWVDWAANIRANTTDVGGVENIRGSERVMVRRVNVLIRYRSGLTTDMRIRVSDGRLFAIVSAVEIPRKRGIQMVCEEYSV